jgi:thioredoxin 1
MTEPLVDELAVEYAGRIRVGKLNVDRNPRIRQRYQIAGVPTFAVFRDGEILQRRTGAQSKQQLVDLLEETL